MTPRIRIRLCADCKNLRQIAARGRCTRCYYALRNSPEFTPQSQMLPERRAWLDANVPNYDQLDDAGKERAKARAKYHTDQKHRSRHLAGTKRRAEARKLRRAAATEQVLDEILQEYRESLADVHVEVARPPLRMTCLDCNQRPSMTGMTQCAPCHAVGVRQGRMVASSVA